MCICFCEPGVGRLEPSSGRGTRVHHHHHPLRPPLPPPPLPPLPPLPNTHTHPHTPTHPHTHTPTHHPPPTARRHHNTHCNMQCCFLSQTFKVTDEGDKISRSRLPILLPTCPKDPENCLRSSPWGLGFYNQHWSGFMSTPPLGLGSRAPRPTLHQKVVQLFYSSPKSYI